MKSKSLNFLQLSMQEALKKQDNLLENKFRLMKETLIGKKLGIGNNQKLENIPLTNYSFYREFYDNPSGNSLMFDRDAYVTIESSGTAGARKKFLIPKRAVNSSLKETGMALLMLMFHDGQKITLEYGDNIFVSTGPGPFAGGIFTALGSREMGIVRFVPNINLSYNDKVDFFVHNYEKISGAAMYASTLVSQVIPKLQKPIKLKGIITQDSVIADVNKETIKDFIGVYPKTSYSTTETLICSVASLEYPLGFIFDWRRGIFEFKPVNKDKTELLKIDELSIGDIYQPVFTSLDSEITRYALNDLVKVVGKKDDLLGSDWPVMKYDSRIEKTISIQNFTRINESELLQVLREVGVPFTEFTARSEVEGPLEYMVLYIEFSKEVSIDFFLDKIHTKLCEIDSDYLDLTRFFDYRPIKIRSVEPGTFAKFLAQKATSLPKVERVGMSNEEFADLSCLFGNLG